MMSLPNLLVAWAGEGVVTNALLSVAAVTYQCPSSISSPNGRPSFFHFATRAHILGAHLMLLSFMAWHQFR